MFYVVRLKLSLFVAPSLFKWFYLFGQSPQAPKAPAPLTKGGLDRIIIGSVVCAIRYSIEAANKRKLDYTLT